MHCSSFSGRKPARDRRAPAQGDQRRNTAPEISDRIKKLGTDQLTMSVAEFTAMIQRELAENARLIKAAGLKAN